VEWVTTSTIVRDLADYENAAAWSRFVERFQAPIARFVAGLGVPAGDAEDIAQETLIAFAETLRSGRYQRERGRLRTWLFGIAYKQMLRERERRGRRPHPIGGDRELELALERLPDEQTASASWNHHWEQFVLRRCFEQIGREFRPESVRAFDLVVRDDRSPQDAAAALGVPIKAIYNAKHRILKRLRELRAELEDGDAVP
jgi:RNA polymerase sigma-70 factor (ECF subfamily)